MALPIHDFVRLMLAKLAENTLEICYNEPQNKTAILPFNYRERIENILCADNGWKEKFSSLIDVEEYFEDHFYWEEHLARTLLNVVKEWGKKFTFNLVQEYMSVIFSTSEIQKILKDYDDMTVKNMGHFVNLLLNNIYSRRYREEFFDYSARSVAKMRVLSECEKQWDNIKISTNDVSSTRKNDKLKMQFVERIRRILAQKNSLYKEEQTRKSEKKKELEEKLEKQARDAIENLIFPSLEKVIMKSETPPSRLVASFTIKNDFLSHNARFICGVLNSDYSIDSLKYFTVIQDSIEIDFETLKVMRKIAKEYGLLSEQKHWKNEEYEIDFWIKGI